MQFVMRRIDCIIRIAGCYVNDVTNELGIRRIAAFESFEELSIVLLVDI
jgi:hypothetical protein